MTVRGVCWSTSENPTISSSHTSDGNGTGAFTSSITGLNPGTTYYVRAYATNSAGTNYGSDRSFTTLAVSPTVTTTTVSVITSNSASSGGNVTSAGGTSVTAKGVCWSTSVNPTISDSHTSDGSGTGAFTSNMTGLSAATTYHVRAYATNSAGTSYGSEVTFTTLATTPTVTTTAVTAITSSSASSGGNVTSDGGGSVTARGVCWSTSSNPTVSNSHTSDGTGTGAFTSNVTSLSPATTYYVRAYATNSAGTNYGSDRNFTTLPEKPTATTGSATSVTTGSATLNGIVNPNGATTDYYFQYGTTTGYGTNTTSTSAGSGSSAVSLDTPISGLACNTIYHYRLVATNSEGTGYGSDKTFTSSTCPPAGSIPDTGQTECYNDSAEITCPQPGEDFYGQDANYTIYPSSYTKLDANGNTLSASATSWFMVKDNVTGLIWEVKTDDGSIHDKDSTYTWQGAQDEFIAALNSSGFGGYTDWRMPTIKELAYIVNHGTFSPAIDTSYFPNTVSSYYWSSTTAAGYTSFACYIDFNFGYDNRYNKLASSYVRAVRGGQSTNSFVDNGNGTVTDTSTGLMWQQATASGTYTWKAALSYCESLTLAGYTDWRLPTVKELRSIVDYDRYAPTIDTTYFLNTDLDGYWSSTTYASSTRTVLYINLRDGSTYTNGKDFRYYVRAARGGQ